MSKKLKVRKEFDEDLVRVLFMSFKNEGLLALLNANKLNF